MCDKVTHCYSNQKFTKSTGWNLLYTKSMVKLVIERISKCIFVLDYWRSVMAQRLLDPPCSMISCERNYLLDKECSWAKLCIIRSCPPYVNEEAIPRLIIYKTVVITSQLVGQHCAVYWISKATSPDFSTYFNSRLGTHVLYMLYIIS